MYALVVYGFGNGELLTRIGGDNIACAGVEQALFGASPLTAARRYRRVVRQRVDDAGASYAVRRRITISSPASLPQHSARRVTSPFHLLFVRWHTTSTALPARPYTRATRSVIISYHRHLITPRPTSRPHHRARLPTLLAHALYLHLLPHAAVETLMENKRERKNEELA